MPGLGRRVDRDQERRRPGRRDDEDRPSPYDHRRADHRADHRGWGRSERVPLRRRPAVVVVLLLGVVARGYAYAEDVETAEVSTRDVASASLPSGTAEAGTAEAGTGLGPRLVLDAFESGTLPGRAVTGIWTRAADGSAVLAQTAAGSPNARWVEGSGSWRDYEVSVRVRPTGQTRSGASIGLLARVAGDGSHDRLLILPNGQAQLQTVKGRDVQVLASTVLGRTGPWLTLTLRESGSTVTGLVDGQIIGAGPGRAVAGRVGLQTRYAAAHFDDLTVTSLAPDGSATPAGPASGPSPTTTG